MANPNLIIPKYSVVVLIYHRSKELLQMALNCIGSIKVHSKDYELIIVDNGSSEKYDWGKECNTYIRFDKNMGISHGWNAGIKNARGKYIVILSDDTIVSPDWLLKLEESMLQPHAGVGQLYVEHLPQGVGIVETYKWPSGACFMLNKNTIDRVGYFDEMTYYPANWEDLDYWLRVYKKGLRIYRNYTTTIKHLEGQTVHAKDISEHFMKMKKAFIDKHGVDPTETFFGNQTMEELLRSSH